MIEPISVVEVEQVEQDGETGIVVTFSDGKRARYSASLLQSLSERTPPPVPSPEGL